MGLINEIIGDFGKFHLVLYIIIFINKLGVALHQMAIIFLAPPVNYYCPDSTSSCCNNPVYNTTIFTKTIVMEWNLICGNSWLKDFTQTLFQFGVLIGSFILGIASDRYGRRPTLIFSVILEVFTGIMASFLPDFWSFSIVRMILGFSVGGVMVAGFVIIMEYAGNITRDVVSALYQVPFTMGYMALALFGYFIRDYMYFQLAISLSCVILLIYICILPETPRWLLAMNRTAEAVKLIERVAKINNLPAGDIEQKIQLYQLEQMRGRTKKGTVVDLFRTPNLRRNIMVMSFIWLVSSYCFYGAAQYTSYLTGNIFINVITTGVVCLFSCFLVIPLLKFMGRKTIIIVCNAASGLSLLLIAFIAEGITSVVFGCIGVVSSFMVLVVAYLYCTEMFPTVVRNAALGISSMMARVGSMIAPFIAGLRPYGQWCAPVAFGIFPLIAACLCLLLPETKDCELMTTIEQAEAFKGRPSRTNDNDTATDGVT